MPWEDASADMSVSAAQDCKVPSEVSSCFSLVKASACIGPHSHPLFTLTISNSLKGWDNSLMFGVNFPNWLIIPRNLWSSVTGFVLQQFCWILEVYDVA